MQGATSTLFLSGGGASPSLQQATAFLPRPAAALLPPVGVFSPSTGGFSGADDDRRCRASALLADYLNLHLEPADL